MSRSARKTHNQHPRASLNAYLVLGVTLLLTLLASYSAYQSFRSHQMRHLDQGLDRTVHAIQSRINSYIDSLFSSSAMFNAKEDLTRQDFQRYIHSIDIQHRYPGMQNIGYIRRTNYQQKKVFSQKVREDLQTNPCGYPKFSIFPQGTRTEYMVIDFIEPIAHNYFLFGKDMATNPACREAMERARDTGLASITRLIQLDHATLSGPGFILLVPIYRNGANTQTLEQRRAALNGYVFAHFLAQDLFDHIFAQKHANIDFRIYDGTEQKQESLYYTSDLSPDIQNNKTHTKPMKLKIITIGGHQWTFAVIGQHTNTHQLGGLAPLFIFIMGSILSAYLFRITQLQIRQAEERQQQSVAPEYQATHDSLTHLASRNYLYEKLEIQLFQTQKLNKQCALLLIDLDGFKEINDTLGHHNGDLLLKNISERLHNLFDEIHTLARLGGDEFALLIPIIKTVDDAIDIANEILKHIRMPFELDGITVQVDASIGIAIAPQHGEDANLLLRHADVAMYIAKKTSSGYSIYDPNLDEYSPRRLALISELGQAMDKGQLVLYYQPKIDIKSQTVVGLEALIRWQHPTQGLIPPDQFIPQAEMSSLIRPLTLWVAQTAIKQCREWHHQGLRTKIAINISARNLIDTKLPDKISELLQEQRLEPGFLELEITESALISDPERAYHVLNKLYDIGVNLTIDDFGTGYSSLAYLKKLPISTLKVDISFVRDIIRDDNDAVIVHSTVNLAHNLGMKVVAEGVEGADILELLSVIDCDQGQGYFICRPLPAEEVIAWVRSRSLERV